MSVQGHNTVPPMRLKTASLLKLKSSTLCSTVGIYVCPLYLMVFMLLVSFPQLVLIIYCLANQE